MKCLYCKKGLVLAGDYTEGRVQTPKKFRCIFCGIEFRKRKNARNSSTEDKPTLKGRQADKSVNYGPHNQSKGIP